MVAAQVDDRISDRLIPDPATFGSQDAFREEASRIIEDYLNERHQLCPSFSEVYADAPLPLTEEALLEITGWECDIVAPAGRVQNWDSQSVLVEIVVEFTAGSDTVQDQALAGFLLAPAEAQEWSAHAGPDDADACHLKVTATLGVD